MAEDFKAAANAILSRIVTSDPGVPGVVAMVTDRERNIYGAQQASVGWIATQT